MRFSTNWYRLLCEKTFGVKLFKLVVASFLIFFYTVLNYPPAFAL